MTTLYPEKEEEREDAIIRRRILMKSEVMTHRQVELSLNSAAISLQLVLFLPRLITIMGFVEEGKKERKKKVFHRVPLRFLTPQLEHKEAGGQAEWRIS